MLKKRCFALALALILCFAALTGCAAKEAAETETEAPTESAAVMTAYTATAEGKNGDVTVQVTFDGSRIAEVVVLDHSETAGVSDPAIETIPEEIVEFQSVAVDTISGATMTSKAILTAVADCVAQAGFDIASYSIAAEKEAVYETLTADVVIVGGGGAGLAAAVEASATGANVILLEKMGALGGSTGLSAGGLLAYPTNEDTSVITLEEIADVFNTYSAPSPYFDESITEDYLTSLNDTVEWTKSLGYVCSTTDFASFIRIDPEDRNSYFEHYLVLGGGSEFTLAAGSGLISVMAERAEENGAKIMTDTPAVELIVDGNGVVEGVMAVSGDNVHYTIEADAVVLACGGFGNNPDMVAEYLEPVNYVWAGGAGNTGDGITMAKTAGAALQLTTSGVYVPWCTSSLGKETCLMVDNYGNRFVDESLSQVEIGIDVLRKNQTGSSMYWAVLESDSEVMPGIYCENIGAVAELIGADEATLRNTFTRYNELAGKEDVDFGKDTDLMTGITMDGPYYLVQNAPNSVQTNGGVDVNGSMEVLREDGSVIEGLYAAGELCNQVVFGEVYPICGGSVNYVVYSGRIAGTQAAEFAVSK